MMPLASLVTSFANTDGVSYIELVRKANVTFRSRCEANANEVFGRIAMKSSNIHLDSLEVRGHCNHMKTFGIRALILHI